MDIFEIHEAAIKQRLEEAKQKKEEKKPASSWFKVIADDPIMGMDKNSLPFSANIIARFGPVGWKGTMVNLIQKELWKLEREGKLVGVEPPEVVADKENPNSGFAKVSEERGKKKEDTKQEKIPNVDLPFIRIPKPGKLISTFGNEIVQYFKDNHELFYRPREEAVQKLKMMPVCGDNDPEIIGFSRISPDEFITYIENYVRPGFKVYDKRKEDWVIVPSSIGINQAKTLLACKQMQDQLPVIDVIYNVPVPILRNGVIGFPKRGYDPDYWSWMPLDAPNLDVNMDIDIAKQVLDKLFKEFCFEKNQDRVNAIAGLLTPFIRGLYARPSCRTPIFFYKANRERAGKDYCADVASILYFGVANSEPPIGDDEEFRKKILSTLRSGKTRLHLSNNKGFINSPQLESLATAETFTDRILGQNTTLSFVNNLEISLSANTGITYTPDLANRCIFINLFLAMEDPNNRNFETPDLHGWVKDNRELILSALYALVRNWYDKGMPTGSVPFASYPEWSRVCGGIMDAAELGNPCTPNVDIISIGGDDETRDMKRLFELCYELWPDKWVKKSDVMYNLENVESFRELFSWMDWGKEGGSARKRFGVLMEKFVGRVFSDIQLIRQDNTHQERRLYKWVKKQAGVGMLGMLGMNYQPYICEKSGLNNRVETIPIIPNIPNLVEESIQVDEKDTKNSENPSKSNRNLIIDLLRLYPDGIKESQGKDVVANQMDSDTYYGIVDQLKKEGEVMEMPPGMLRLVE